jgi:selenium-binding protein 1
MDRRQFLHASAGLAATAAVGPGLRLAAADTPGFASPKEAVKGPREKHLFVACLYGGTGVKEPDYLAVVDTDPASPTYSQVVHRLEMKHPDDELHHFGWNICSSCHGKPGDRRYLIIPGVRSSRIYVVDAKDPLNLKHHKTIEPEEVKKANLSGPHTVHCLPDGTIVLSMLGDGEGNAPGGFLLLDENYDVKGRWDKEPGQIQYNYDFWYQTRHNVMVSSAWAAPNTFLKGFNPADVKAGKYGHHLYFWDWKDRKVAQTVDLGETGLLPLEVRFLHDPDRPNGFVGAALSSTMWHFTKAGDRWRADKVIEVEPVKAGGQDVPGLITDLLVSMDDRFLYLSNWLHGDVRQYDIRDPAKPKLTGQLFVGGLIGKAKEFRGKKLGGGPQMLQLSLDGKRLYTTNSLLSVWDNQFYPDLAKQGSWMLQIDCDTDKGGLSLNERYFVDFSKEPNGPSRAHEMRYPGGDCTSDIFS